MQPDNNLRLKSRCMTELYSPFVLVYVWRQEQRLSVCNPQHEMHAPATGATTCVPCPSGAYSYVTGALHYYYHPGTHV
jgi:hypothetical protein